MRRDAERSSSGWRLDEVAHAGRENLDVNHVAFYDDKEDANADSEVGVLIELGLDERSTVVDLGAGTGQFTVAVAPACARVVAVDISPVMLDRLRVKIDTAGFSNVEVVHAGFLSYEHSGSPADFVYSRWALHHLPDFWKAMASRHRRTRSRRALDLRVAVGADDRTQRLPDRGRHILCRRLLR